MRQWEIWRSHGSVSHTGRVVQRHRTLASASGVLSVLDPARVEHRTQGVSCLCIRWPILNRGCMSESTGRSECVRWCASGVRRFCNPLYA